MVITERMLLPKSKKRSELRKQMGRLLYCMARRLQWLLDGQKYASLIRTEPLPHACAVHSTPMLRKLANVDMWMQVNKVTNLRLAAARLNGIVVKPGETFSFWKLVGKPTARKGYLPGMVLCGGSFRPGVGDGLCQMTNLIYWMALHTPLIVTERHRHSYDVFPDSGRTQPFGSGASCAWNYLDLQIRNDTDVPYQLLVRQNGSQLEGQWRSTVPGTLEYVVYERDPMFLSNPMGGYVRHNELWRRVLDGDGVPIRNEFIAENNALMMYQPFLKGG